LEIIGHFKILLCELSIAFDPINPLKNHALSFKHKLPLSLPDIIHHLRASHFVLALPNCSFLYSPEYRGPGIKPLESPSLSPRGQAKLLEASGIMPRRRRAYVRPEHVGDELGDEKKKKESLIDFYFNTLNVLVPFGNVW